MLTISSPTPRTVLQALSEASDTRMAKAKIKYFMFFKLQLCLMRQMNFLIVIGGFFLAPREFAIPFHRFRHSDQRMF